MKKFYWALIPILIFIQCFSCEKGYENYVGFFIYQTNNDYSENIYITMDENKNSIVSYPGYVSYIDTSMIPKKLINGYYLGYAYYGVSNVNSVVTSLKLNTYTKQLSQDSLLKLVIDRDPFITFYHCERTSKNDQFWSDEYGIDTMLINDVIREGELEKFFEKQK